MSEDTTVNCPTCKKSVKWNEQSEFRPFCSDRCQKIDLGAWADESYSIPTEIKDDWNDNSLSDESSSQTYSLQ